MTKPVRLWHKAASLALCALMAFSLLPASAFSDAGGGGGQPPYDMPAGGAGPSIEAWQAPDEYVYAPMAPPAERGGGAPAPETAGLSAPEPGAEAALAILEACQALQGGAGFSDLSPQEASQVSMALGAKEGVLDALQEKGLSLAQSLPYAQLEEAYGFAVEDLLANCPAPGDCSALFKEMKAYGQFLDESWQGTEADQAFRRFLLGGFTLQQVKNAYVVSQTLSIPMEGLLAKGGAQTAYPEGMTEVSRENYRLYAADLGVREQALVDYANENSRTFKRVEALVRNGRLFELQLRDPEEGQAAYGAYEASLAAGAAERAAQWEASQDEAFAEAMAELASIGYSETELLAMGADRQGGGQLAARQSSQAQAQGQGPGAPSMPLLASSAPGDFYLADPYVNDSYGYHGRERYRVNLSTGSFSQEFIDAAIPGRNGLDLVIGRQYFSDQAYLDREIGVADYDLGNTKYRLSSGFMAFASPGGPRLPSYFDMDYPSRIFDTYALAADFAYYSTEPDGYRVVSGVSVWYEFWQAIDMTSPEPYYSTTLWTDTLPNTHFTDMYGLGMGWKFMFSSIEEYGAGHAYQFLHLSDGAVYPIDWGNPSSHLKGYFLTDMILTQPGALSVPGVGAACWDLAYKDGKHEYFNDLGQLIGIVDRHGNTIRLVHTKDPNGLPRIEITDTWGNAISIYGVLTGGGHTMKVDLPIGGLQYSVDKTALGGSYYYLTLNGSYDQMGNGTSYGYAGLFGTTVDLYNNGNSALNRYNQLTDTQYPNGVKDTFEHGKTTHYVSDTFLGYREAYRLDKATAGGVPAPDSQGGMAHETRYAYSASGHCRPVILPTSYTYTTTATEVSTRPVNGVPVDTVSTSTVYTFDWKGLVTKAETRTSGGALAKAQAIEYDQFRLPSKVADRSYDSGGSAYREEVSMSEHDRKGNVVATWSPLAGGDRNNVYFRSYYTYDTDYYSLLLSKVYWQDINTLVTEEYAPDSATHKHIDRQETWVYQGGNALKARADFGYDAYGNVASVKRYKDDFINYVETEYSYPNGALLTEVRTSGIKNADGTMAAGTPGYAAGTVATKTGYDAMGLPASQTDANNLATGFQRNLRGDVTVVTNPDLTTKQYSRNYAQNTLLFTDERGAQTLYKFMAGTYGGQAGHNGEAAVDVLSGDTLWYRRYDELGRLEEEGDLYGKTRYAYDGISRLAQKQARDGQGAVVAQEDYAYDEVYNGASQRRVQKTVLGEAGAPSIVTAVYTDKNGRAVQAGRFLGGAELLDAYTYDYVGNLLTERSAFAADRGLAYSGKWEYDYAGRVTKTYNADGGYATNIYNSLGLMASAADYAGTVSEYAYDGLGRLLEEKAPVEAAGGTTHYAVRRHTYDPAGNVKREEWTNNPVGSAYAWGKADYDYNSRGLLEYATAYDGPAVDGVAKYTYDGAGNLRFVEAGKSGKGAADGKATEYTYDRFGNQLTATDPLGQTETRQYNTSGLMTGRTDRNGNGFAYAYDGLKRLKTVTVTQGGAVTEGIAYGYYLTGAKKREESTTRGWLAYAYDSLGRLSAATESGGVAKQYGYNKADSRETFLAQVNNATVLDMSYTYDSQGRLSTVKQGGAVVGTYGYDANGNRDSLAYANGATATYAYNKANWLTGVANQKGGATLSSYAYSYYADGNQRTKSDQGGRVSTYLYDGLGRLKSESESTGLSLTYDYDRHGNRTAMAASGAENYSTAYRYDGNNRLEAEEKAEGGALYATAYGYDANGNQTHWAKSALAPAGQGQEEVSFGAGDAALYEYDAFNQMTSAYAGGGLTEYAYRVDGLRQSKSAAAGSVAHVWDGGSIVADLDGGGAVVASYVRGAALLRANTLTGAAYYLYNGHGDVTGLANSAGALAREYDYDAFGNEREIAGQAPSADANPFRYAGEYFDAESGTYYLRARRYSPRSGRFLSEDPAHDGLNWYTYAANNPLRWVDPSGMIIELSSEATETDKQAYERAIKYLTQSSTFTELYQLLMDSQEVFTIVFNSNLSDNYFPISRKIYWDPTGGLVLKDIVSVMSPAMALAHEMGHGAQYLSGLLKANKAYTHIQMLEIEEANLLSYETPIAKELREYSREKYSDGHRMQRVFTSTDWGIMVTVHEWHYYLAPWHWGTPSKAFMNQNMWTPIPNGILT